MQVIEAKKYIYQDVTGWLVSEKLNGVRAIWDGEDLYSKNGNRFNAPEWFKKLLPGNVYLEGELYIGLDTLGKTAGTVRKKIPIDSELKLIQYCIFDAPKYDDVYKERLAYCKKIISNSDNVNIIRHKYFRTESQLNEFYEDIVSAGGEGIILRNPFSYYELCRSNNYLKCKPKDDDEAKVIGYSQPEGIFRKRVRSIVCKWKGKVFDIDMKRNIKSKLALPNIGSMITFSYQDICSAGLPLSPLFLSVRDYE